MVLNVLDLDERGDQVRPVLDGDFEFVQLGDNPTRSEKINVGLPLEVRTTLIECLQDNAGLFAITLHEMPKIDPSVACLQLNMDSSARYTSQRQRRPSPKKDEATASTVKSLLYAKFISKAKYT